MAVRKVADNTGLILGRFKAHIRKVVTTACFDCEAKTKQNIVAVNAVDTGALLNSVYVDAPNKHGYSKASSEAKARRPDVEILPEHKGKSSEYACTGIVAVGVEYGYCVENGTSRMPGRPFFEPAVQETNAEFEKECKKLIG